MEYYSEYLFLQDLFITRFINESYNELWICNDCFASEIYNTQLVIW